MLTVKNIQKSYTDSNEDVSVLKGIDLELKGGGIHAVVGPSGCGKSTFLLICGGLLQPSKGTVLVNDENLFELKGDERSKLRASLVGYVFQKFHLIPYLNIEQNILASSLSMPNENLEDRCKELVEELGLGHRLKHIPSKLSSGEQQRVALARALLNKPKILIADEPTGNLDTENGNAVFDIFKKFSDEGGLVLMATHDRELAKRADSIQSFDKGLLVSSI